MIPQTLVINILAASITLTDSIDALALASIELTTHYSFDDNVIATIVAIDEKSAVSTADPLNNIVFKIELRDKIDNSLITQMQGRLFTSGGAEALEEQYPNNFSYIAGKLDFYGALDSEYDFFESVETKYSAAQAAAIKTALDTIGILNQMGDYRTKSKTIAVPATAVVPATADELKRTLLDMKDQPRYLVCAETDNLPYIESLAEVMDKTNCHVMIDVGNLTSWELVTAFAESISIDDHRLTLYWNPNKSRPSNATTVLARKKWRPCVGDLLAQTLLRNARTNSSGIPPINRPVAGYDFPLAFRDMEKMAGVSLDEEAQNALASAGVNVVINERFEGGDRWIYGDALTQYDSENSALRLTNSAEIETYTTNLVLSIVKKHMLKGMTSFVRDAQDECSRALDACVASGLLVLPSELGGLYYLLQITPRADDPFSKADIKFSRRPEGCARQVFFEGTVTK
ncbi:hypothetical protein [Psychrobacter sp. AOP31-E1-50]|uniref:hypothetical protein n=1 Tax=Psychrobacter sp. AOP31-E1-50 TaxID=3457692 RepID=UPI003FDBBC41